MYCIFKFRFPKKRETMHEIRATFDNNFRRAHPSGLTIGEYLRKDLSDKVGGADVFVGLPDTGKHSARSDALLVLETYSYAKM